MDSPIPNFVSARTLAHVLSSRAKVHLLLGQSAAAFEDLETLEVVMKSFESEPGTLVTAMIHVAVAGLYLETIEEGLRHKLWAEPELQKLTAHLLEMNLFAQVKQGIRAERAGVLRMLSALAERKSDPLHQATMDAFTSGEWTVERAIIKVSPPAWIRASQADYARMIQGYLDAIDPEHRRLHQNMIDQQNTEVAELMSRWSPKNRILMYVTPSFSKAATTMAKNQMRAHQLAIACALEQYRSRHDRYPSKLEELVPDYLAFVPNDVYTGEPISYVLRASGYKLLVSDSQAKQPVNTGNFVWQGE